MNLSETLSADFIDAQYKKWKSDPSSLSDDWQFFFKGFELAGAAGPADADPEQALRQARVGTLIHRYQGHRPPAGLHGSFVRLPHLTPAFRSGCLWPGCRRIWTAHLPRRDLIEQGRSTVEGDCGGG